MSGIDWFAFYHDKLGDGWYYEEIRSRHVDITLVSPFTTVLGIGSGRCIVEDYLARSRFTVASDSCRRLLAAAKQRHVSLVHYVCCDAFHLPFADQAFGCVYSQGFMEHFTDAEAQALVAEMLRAAGVAVFSMPLPTYQLSPVGVEHRRTLHEWRRLLIQYNVDVGSYEDRLGGIGVVTVMEK